ncbi:DUF305 domain-containing protein [Micromonospora sp. DR5-3]|uniref:DUF305 domain-containing protein n=1 Tax=unclassified Micromonospora TaxID=2617518 RepID=UPI001651F00B|nr:MULTISPECIES: DUF305 domain-containing protein [unclassified Micromonospora]MCW3816385.1 DUF305 domain-containing protein [Micromonospora sp. DR5-3]
MAATVVVGSGVGVALWANRDDPSYRPPSAHVVQPGAPGQPGRSLSGNDLSQVSPPGFTAADSLFIQGMIPHHAQALEMTALLEGRTTNPDVTLLAKRIDVSQRDEIARMQRWLAERNVPSSGPNAHASHDKLMPGMLTAEQFDQLKQARGAEFDRLFLTFMIRHHQGALAMVEELYATGGGLEPASDQFAREVNADQGIEIQRMQEMLAKMG